MPLDTRNRMHVRQWGGHVEPVFLSLHGGPASGGGPAQWLPFANQACRLLVPDQRGAGRSYPRGTLRGNQLTTLVADLERLRTHLQLERWNVWGGSWGATLALAYAARHPDRVQRLVLRGGFDGQAKTVNRLFFRPKRAFTGPAAVLSTALNPHASWHKLLHLLHFGTVSVTQQQALKQWQACERQALLKGLQKSLRATTTGHARRTIREQIRALHSSMRQSLRPNARVHVKTWRAWRHVFRIQAHYFAHGCFLQRGQWAQHLNQIARHQIRVDLVHGQYDAVCPPHIARHVAQRLNTSCIHWAPAGHLGTEPATLQALRKLCS